MPAQLKWKEVKAAVYRIAKRHSRKQAYSLSKAEQLLQYKRAGLVKKIDDQLNNANIFQPQLSVVEHQLSDLQQYHTKTLAIRAGVRWRELSELSPGYLKRTVATRSTRTLIPSLLHPISQSISTTKDEMLDAAATFYTNLYSPTPDDQCAIEEILGSLPDTLHLSLIEQQMTIAHITFDDILQGVSRCPKTSNPGPDGLPYEILRLIISHPTCRELVLAVFNSALTDGMFPLSWQETTVSLLPKKGDLSDLRN